MLIEEVTVTPEMLYSACLKAEAMGALNNSVMKGAGNVVGFVGEAIAQQVLGGTFENLDNEKPNYNYDLLIDGMKVDVKAKRTSVRPLDTYDCSVWAKNTKQKCDAYAFVRVKDSLTVGWFLGTIPKELFYKKARFLEKGEKDPSNGWKVKADCYNLEIKELETWQKTLKSLSK